MKLQMMRRSLALLFSLLLVGLVEWSGAAEKTPQSVQVMIRSILASNKSDDFDPKLKDMEQPLKALKHRSYRLLKDDGKSIPWRGTQSFEIPGGRSLSVTPQEFQNNRIGLKIQLTERDKPLLDTTVTVPNKGNSLYLGGPPHEGGNLVLSISAAAH
jgi:hypothetical protein